MSTPTLTVIRGDCMDADAAAWAMLAETAERALRLPGLSPDGHRLIAEAVESCWYAAGVEREVA